MNKSLLGVALAAVGAMTLSSCSNELNEPSNLPGSVSAGLKLAKDPQVSAWSGTQNLANPYFATRDDINQEPASSTNWNKIVEEWDMPYYTNTDDLDEEDIRILKEKLSFEKEVQNSIVIPWTNYWIQQVYTGEDEYQGYDRCDEEDLNNPGGPHKAGDLLLGSQKMDKLRVYVGEGKGQDGFVGVSDFNYGSNSTLYEGSYKDGTVGDDGQPIEKHFSITGTSLMYNMPLDEVNATNQFDFWDSTSSKPYHSYYIIVYKGCYYIGFDYESHKDTEAVNHNDPLDYDRDWKFTDWIVRIMPAYTLGNTPEDEDEILVPDEPGDGPGNPGDKDKEEGDKPGSGVKPSNHQNEVEVNLAVNDEHVDKEGKGINDLVAKLSIHVRHAGDVEIFIPIDAEYYCDNDDLVILKDHNEGNFVHGGTPVADENGKITSRTVDYVIAGVTVTLTVTYETDGIRITTSGINETVIEYLQENFGDGINFEVMLYFNDSDEFDRDALFAALNQATIRFLEDENGNENLPDEFINAFTDNDVDCDVTIVEEQGSDYEYAGQGPHLNGSDKNKIYTKKGSEPEDELEP